MRTTVYINKQEVIATAIDILIVHDHCGICAALKNAIPEVLSNKLQTPMLLPDITNPPEDHYLDRLFPLFNYENMVKLFDAKPGLEYIYRLDFWWDASDREIRHRVLAYLLENTKPEETIEIEYDNQDITYNVK